MNFSPLLALHQNNLLPSPWWLHKKNRESAMSPPVCFHAFMLNWDGGTKASCRRCYDRNFHGTRNNDGNFLGTGNNGGGARRGESSPTFNAYTLDFNTHLFALRREGATSLKLGGQVWAGWWVERMPIIRACCSPGVPSIPLLAQGLPGPLLWRLPSSCCSSKLVISSKCI